MFKFGIKRRFFPGWKWYFVEATETEVIGDSARLILTFPSGVQLAIPGIHKRKLCVYPEGKATSQGTLPDGDPGRSLF